MGCVGHMDTIVKYHRPIGCVGNVDMWTRSFSTTDPWVVLDRWT